MADDLPQLIAEIDFEAASTGTALVLDDTARGQLDVGTLAAGPLWTDVAPYVASMSCRVGATRMDGPVLRYEAGSATLVLHNEDRRFDPSNLAGPYVVGGSTQVEPMRAIRIRANWAGLTYTLWSGFSDTWDVAYDDEDVSTVTLTCIDGMAVLAAHTNRLASTPVGAGETTGARIARILDSISWPAGDRYLDTGDSVLAATDLSGDARAEAQLAADSELGEFYFDAQGRAFFRGRHRVYSDTRSNTPQGIFGDVAGELRYADVTMRYDAASIYNRIVAGRPGGVPQVLDAGASQAEYLVRPYDTHATDLLLTTDAECQSWAQFLRGQVAVPELRFAGMRVLPQSDPTSLYPQVLGRWIGDRLTVRRRPPGGGSVNERDVLIRGISHVMDEAGGWETTWVFQDAQNLSAFVLDSSTLGVLDRNALAY